jgi:putative nucleotidyltransferase with HDIG domain
MPMLASIHDLETKMEQIVLKRISSDRLVLPTMPGAAARALEVIKSPDCSVKQIAAILGRDPVLALQVVRVANGAAYGGNAQTIEAAATRLGIQKLEAIIIEAGAYKVFRSPDARIAKACQDIWDHSLAVGLLARDLIGAQSSTDAEAAYLSGLLHDIGKPVVAGLLLQAEKQLTGGREGRWLESSHWIEIVNRIHRPLGVAIAEKWCLPAPVQASIRDCSELDAGNRAAVANYVCFANATVKSLGLYVGSVDTEDAQALTTIGRSLLGLDEELARRLASEVKSRLRSVD